MKKIALTTFLLLLTTLPLLSQEIFITEGEWKQTVPAVAWNGIHFQVAWSDNRYDDWRYYGVHVSEDGVVGDEKILVGPSSRIYQNTQMCSNGEDFLLSWSRYQTTGCPSYIYGQIIDSSGCTTTNYFQIDLSNHGIISENQKVCSTGSEYICVWTQGSFPFFKPVGQRIGSDGTLINSNIEIETIINTYSNPDIAFDGTHYLCVWNTIINGSISLRGRLLTPEGVFFGNELDITLSDNAQQCAAMAYADSTFLVVWEEFSFAINMSHIFGQFISRQCSLIGEAFLISINSNLTERNPRVCSTGNSYLVTWQQDNPDNSKNLYAQKLDLNGEPVGELYEILSDYQQVALQYNTCASLHKYFVVWEEVQDVVSSYIKGYLIDNLPVSVEEVEQELEMNILVYPNPVTDQSIIQYYLDEPMELHFTVYDIKGRTLVEKDFKKTSLGNIKISMYNFFRNKKNGIYLLQFKNNVINKTMKLVIVNAF